ncbi:DUF2516 family protein [Nesterenkonia sp. MY13]|uniref:DUF2516 family protein n=1 Tax=Nesterenkonia sedimenti TaxID=1463632 RepID=A0A7X8TL82_9MICC|nr:DUF2516 family protein [Nesterenkonia sedimenti]NLS10412.1 DUF2516 family protein [Nesterenkonia sedimenti]
MALTIESLLWLILSWACLILAVVALLKCMTRNSDLFFARGKRTKQFWLGMTGGACALCVLGFFPTPFSLLMPLAGACMAAVYLADVDPEVRA